MKELDFSLIVAVYSVLLALGCGYNALVAYAGRKGYLEGFTSLAVVVGVFATLGGVAVISWQAALLALGAFVASGLPMMAGSIGRYIRARKEAQEHVRQAARMAEYGQSRQG